ncbi:MAG: DNA-binding response regulator [Burkholderiales bacterium PBB3]|nr:MAG: DNA-binding response regulator [Burkholderiales bacterium PBB3]
MTTCIIADDELHLSRYLADQLKAAWPELEILATAANGVEADALIAQHQPDLAFLDIQMPGHTGLEVAQAIEGHTQVVFVTAYDEYAVQAFEDGAIDYLLKPVTTERLDKCVARLRERFAQAAPAQAGSTAPALPDLAAALHKLLQSGAVPGLAPQFLRYVRAHERGAQGEQVLQIDVDEVLYFEAADKYTCVMLASGEKLLRTSIAELEAELDPSLFKRIHRSTLVNLRHVHATRRDDTGRMWVRIKQQVRELPVSRAYHQVFGRM